MPRFLVGVALTLLALAPAGQAQVQGFQTPRMAPPGVPTNVGSCGDCYRELQWTGGAAGAPKKCPHCGVHFNYVENDDGTRSKIPGSSGGYNSSYGGSSRGFGRLVGFAVFVVCVVGGVLVKLVGLLFAGGSARPRRKKPRKRRPVEDDDEADAPPRRRDRSRPDDKPVPMATLADDDPGFEVIGDAPPAPSEPPRRAKARLLPPGGPS